MFGSNAAQAGYMAGLRDAENAESFGGTGVIIKLKLSPLEKRLVWLIGVGKTLHFEKK
jgi:hypothetical protein